jgi:hypothetical protein
MAWTASNISTAAMHCIVNGNAATSAGDGPFYAASSTQSYSGDTVNVALYNNSVTTATASTDTLAHNAYLAASGQWVAANELATSGGYTIGGIAVASKTQTFATNVATFTSSAAPLWTSSGAGFTAYGALVYDNTITNKYVYCWNYFGGAQSASGGGTFTINWNASGIFAITCT